MGDRRPSARGFITRLAYNARLTDCWRQGKTWKRSHVRGRRKSAVGDHNIAVGGALHGSAQSTVNLEFVLRRYSLRLNHAGRWSRKARPAGRMHTTKNGPVSSQASCQLLPPRPIRAVENAIGVDGQRQLTNQDAGKGSVPSDPAYGSRRPCCRCQGSPASCASPTMMRCIDS